MDKLGFGLLRLPLVNTGDATSVDVPALCGLVDLFMERGGTYFDTGYTYHNGASETAIREALVKRYPRDSFQLADKLPVWQLKDASENRTYFDEQLRRCGVDFFDVYLIHWLNEENYEICKTARSFDFLRRMKAEGKLGRLGFSYHDKAALLERILAEQPDVELVQLQLNYLDWDGDAVEARKCYEVCVRHGKPVVVMEPVRGGALANLPSEPEALFKSLHPEWSAASWAIRFATSLDNVSVVLSGMNTKKQVEDNMSATEPLSGGDLEAVRQAAEIVRALGAVPCTACGYCAKGCPEQIRIPRYFAFYNEYRRFLPDDLWKLPANFMSDMAELREEASRCVRCGNCERNCPQRIEITKYFDS